MKPAVPKVADAARVRNPIDAFILAKLDEKQLKLAPEADRRTLARRAYFDLHGLPPTPEQVEEFVNDKAPDAYEKLIDRLLASPRYGERWGRTGWTWCGTRTRRGSRRTTSSSAAWRYRDWVIESFNKDTPYTEFVQAQIAADEIWGTNLDHDGHSKLPEEKERNLHRRIGTGAVHDRVVPDRVHVLRGPVARGVGGGRGGHGGSGVPGPDGRVRAVPRS